MEIKEFKKLAKKKVEKSEHKLYPKYAQNNANVI